MTVDHPYIAYQVSLKLNITTPQVNQDHMVQTEKRKHIFFMKTTPNHFSEYTKLSNV